MRRWCGHSGHLGTRNKALEPYLPPPETAFPWRGSRTIDGTRPYAITNSTNTSIYVNMVSIRLYKVFQFECRRLIVVVYTLLRLHRYGRGKSMTTTPRHETAKHLVMQCPTQESFRESMCNEFRSLSVEWLMISKIYKKNFFSNDGQTHT